jgi:nucleotide-binding universal stress UspA family protein
MKMLVATDLSEDGDIAIAAARALRARHGGAIVVAHVTTSAALIARANEELSARLPTDLADSDREIVAGSPGAEIIKLVDETGADMIVLGGRAPSGKRVFGSAAEYVLAQARVPVYIARPAKTTQRIVVATDLTEPGFPAVSRAADIAALLDARITLVHSLPEGASVDPEKARILRRLKRDLPPTAEQVIEHGDAASSVVAVAERVKADLIVVASKGRTGLARFVIGSVASSIVRKASCSVLVVPLKS